MSSQPCFRLSPVSSFGYIRENQGEDRRTPCLPYPSEDSSRKHLDHWRDAREATWPPTRPQNRELRQPVLEIVD